MKNRGRKKEIQVFLHRFCPTCREPFEYDYEQELEDLKERLNNEEITQKECDLAIEDEEGKFKENVLNNSSTEFSNNSCDLCNTSLAGTRYVAHGINDKKDIYHFEICDDCFQYFASEGELVPEDEYLNKNGVPS